MKRDNFPLFLPESRLRPEFLMIVPRLKYRARFVAGSVIYTAAEWLLEWKGVVVITLRDAHIRDAQGRTFVTNMRKASGSTEIVIPNETLVTVIGEKSAYYVPLPRACSLHLELN